MVGLILTFAKNDPRWQRAMERLGLWDNGWHWNKPMPKPDDPATFLRVVEALNAKDCVVHLYPSGCVSIERYPDNQVLAYATPLYEAVIEAFGKE